MTFTGTCGYANSVGFSKYGMATCGDEAGTVEAEVRFLVCVCVF